MSLIKNFLTDWTGIIVNVITLCGWICGLFSPVLLGLIRSKKIAFKDGFALGPFHLSFEMLVLLLVILFIVGLIIIINAYLFRRLLKGAANSTADYKVICDKLPEELQHELDKIDEASPHVNQSAAEYCSSLDEKGFKKLLNSKDVTCRNIRAGSKKGKVILQCSFIPVDANGNTIIIRRRSENHASIFKKVNSWWKHIYAFISFSPIPDGYNREFASILNCYAHEVPLDGTQITDENFQYVGVIYNRRDGVIIKKSSSSQEKSEKVLAKLDECIRYLFVVYLVRYSDLKFIDDDGKVNWNDIDRAFAEKSKRGSKRKDRFFLKDHDYIIGADSLIEIATRLTTNGSAESKRWLKVEQEAIKRARLMIVD